MATDGRAEQIGIHIRQLRRQHNITQTQLGATHYSKSYVSAVEKNNIRPSVEALQFFAEQLGQPRDYFTKLLEQPEDMKQTGALPEADDVRAKAGFYGNQSIEDEALVSLRLLLEHIPHLHIRAIEALPQLTPELIATFPSSEQANYFYFKGVKALVKQEYEAALHALEHALPLASAQWQPAVLDALGQYYYLTHSYPTALHYHRRALSSLQHATSQENESFTVMLHCSDDYSALGAYTQACDMYEQAQLHLHTEHDLKSAALLYLGWGYCIYALTYQAAFPLLLSGKSPPLAEMERGFQRAIEITRQSRSISQISGDLIGDASASLLLIIIELDFSTRWRQLVGISEIVEATSGLSFLDDAEEQCHQLLVSWQDTVKQDVCVTAPHDAIIYVALASLVRIFVQRAILARLSGHDDVALQERLLATHLCQRILDTLDDATFPRALIQESLSLRLKKFTPDTPVLPCLPDSTQIALVAQHRLISWVEAYCAAGEVAEELARVATSPNYAYGCYTLADRCYHSIQPLANSVVLTGMRDPGYLVRYHQRYAYLLEERSTVTPQAWKETSKTLAALCENGLSQIQNAIITAQVLLDTVQGQQG